MSFILWRQATFPKCLPHSFASLHWRKGLTELLCKLRRPSAHRGQAGAGTGSRRVSACSAVCVFCMPVPSSCFSRLEDTACWQASLKPPPGSLQIRVHILGETASHSLSPPLPCCYLNPLWSVNSSAGILATDTQTDIMLPLILYPAALFDISIITLWPLIWQPYPKALYAATHYY